MLCRRLHKRDPNRSIRIITINTKRDSTATAGYISKKAISKCHFHVYATPNIPVTKSVAGGRSRVAPQTLVCGCRGTPRRDSGARTVPAGPDPRAR